MSTSSSRVTPGSGRRTSLSASPTPQGQNPTLRTTGSTRVSTTPNAATPRRRPPSKVIGVVQINGGTPESLSASLKQEIDQKELLLVQLQNKEQTISKIATENDNLSSALTAAENRVNELYAEQSRWEMDMAQRIDIAEKLREQVRDLEKEKRDLQRRYNEQTTTFEAERQAFYDNEQHLKSRIQSLTQARKRSEAANPPPLVETIPNLNDIEADDDVGNKREPEAPQQDFTDPDNEPAEMTTLKLELSTLSTSHTSLQSTLVLLQTQLVDLKRVNQELQEENESYMILLREKTLSGQFDLMRQMGGGSRTSDEEDGDDDDREGNADVGSLHSIGRSTLDRVEEEPEGLYIHMPQDSASLDHDILSPSRSSRHPSKQGRKRTPSTSMPRGESLADLPITGPGLDLAAELGRAENKDMVDGDSIGGHDRSVSKGKKFKKGSDIRKVSGSDTGDHGISTTDVDALRSEVKSLKDANKALSLYASKIIDRIIAQEGFEHVLAIDYEKDPATPSTAGPQSTASRTLPQVSPAKPRPQSVFIGRSSSNPNPTISKVASPPPVKPPNPKRRSLSFDWKTFSFATEKKAEPNLRPLTLKPGSSPVVTGARKLDTHEDEDDKRERERLNATMKLMGIQPAPSIHSSNVTRIQEASSNLPSPSLLNNNRRFSIFGQQGGFSDNSDAMSTHSSLLDAANSSGQGLGFSGGLTHEALEHAEAENTLAALDAHERSLSQEIAKGASGGFTEITPRSLGRRSRRSAGGSGSGSTVWSAGMSGAGEDD